MIMRIEYVSKVSVVFPLFLISAIEVQKKQSILSAHQMEVVVYGKAAAFDA